VSTPPDPSATQPEATASAVDPGAGGEAPPADRAPARTGSVSGTRASATWGALAAGLLFFVVVLVFILQNLGDVRVHFFWVTWRIPLAVDLLLATVLGGLVMLFAGSVRILQLRRSARATASGGAPSGRRFGRR
jgi:uncharacterized integral membrane protein